MAINEEQVRRTAKLAELTLTNEELISSANQLGRVINMMEMLEGMDTEGALLTSDVVETVDTTWQDWAQAGWNRDELLKNAPETEDDFIKVPAIIDNGEAGA